MSRSSGVVQPDNQSGQGYEYTNGMAPLSISQNLKFWESNPLDYFCILRKIRQVEPFLSIK
jgi:hypothetical protein